MYGLRNIMGRFGVKKLLPHYQVTKRSIISCLHSPRLWFQTQFPHFVEYDNSNRNAQTPC